MKSAIALLRRQRSVPSTRDIAEAAGVAEGTIFRAFETKEELMSAAAQAAFCPIPLLRQLEEIDLALPLRDRLIAAAELLQTRFIETFEIIEALGMQGPPPSHLHDHRACTLQDGHRPSGGAISRPHRDPRIDAERVEALIAPDADQLRCTPAELANWLRLLTFSGSHPKLHRGPPLSAEAIVDVLLNGVQRPPPTGTPRRKGAR